MAKIYVLWGMVLLAVLAPAQEQELQQHVKKMIAMLDAENAYERNWAVRQLIALGEPAVSAIAAEYPRRNFTARREMANVLWGIGTPEAKKKLLDWLLDEDGGVRSRVSLALLDLTESDPRIPAKLKDIKSPDPEIQRDIASLQRTILQKNIENGLSGLVSAQGGWGFYEGQFNHLLPLGEDAVPVLLDLFIDGKYRFVVTAHAANLSQRWILRYLAGDALGDFGPCMTDKNNVIRALDHQDIVSKNPGVKEEMLKEIFEIADYTRYRLGDTATLDRTMKALKEKIESYRLYIEKSGNSDYADRLKSELAKACSELATIHLRIRDDVAAVELLNEAIENDPSDSLSRYNLACAYATIGEIEKGLDALEQAVKSGYTDLGWILKDGDLRPLHSSPRFQKIIEDLRQQLQTPK